MSEKGEIILGLCPLPVVDDNNSVVELHDDSSPNPEDEVITGNVSDFPVFKDEEGEVSNSYPACTQSSATCQKSHELAEQQSTERTAKRRRKEGKSALPCCVCKESFQDAHELQLHINTHSDVEIIDEGETTSDESLRSKECALCGKSFRYNSHLKEHILCMHSKTSSFQCPVCALNISTWRKSIDRHMSNHASRVECPTCHFQATSIQAIDNHILTQDAGHLSCKQCDAVFSNRLEFFNHVNDHIPKIDLSNRMVCAHCDLQFHLTSDFNNHVKKCTVRLSSVNSTCSTDNNDNHDVEVIDISSSVNSTCSKDNNDNHDVEVIDISSEVCKNNVAATVVPNNAPCETYQIVTAPGEDGNIYVILIPPLILTPSISTAPTPNDNESIALQVPQEQMLGVASGDCRQNNFAAPVFGRTAQSESDERNVQLITQNLSAADDDCIIVETSDENTLSHVSVENVCSLAVPQDKSSTSNPVLSNALMCLVCSAVLENPESLEKHAESHKITQVIKISSTSKSAANRSFFCKDCGQSFAYQHHLDEHSLTFHGGIEGIACPICKNSIPGEGISLNDHLAKVHNLQLDWSGKLINCTSNK